MIYKIFCEFSFHMYATVKIAEKIFALICMCSLFFLLGSSCSSLLLLLLLGSKFLLDKSFALFLRQLCLLFGFLFRSLLLSILALSGLFC